jgi:crossover junction endodeoxyribonuclease RuvC
VIVGIDPGISGAAAALYPATKDHPSSICEAIDLPTRQDGRRRRIDELRLADWIRQINPSRIVIEAVGPMPSDGRIAAFRFGMSVGVIHTVCHMLGFEPELVQPLVWKSYYLLLDSDKEASRKKALRILPSARPFLPYKKDHNRAEAILIARWADRPPIGRDW